ncbi:radical sam domain-containing protein, partial [Cystoisospora suis]
MWAPQNSHPLLFSVLAKYARSHTFAPSSSSASVSPTSSSHNTSRKIPLFPYFRFHSLPSNFSYSYGLPESSEEKKTSPLRTSSLENLLLSHQETSSSSSSPSSLHCQASPSTRVPPLSSLHSSSSSSQEPSLLSRGHGGERKETKEDANDRHHEEEQHISSSLSSTKKTTLHISLPSPLSSSSSSLTPPSRGMGETRNTSKIIPHPSTSQSLHTSGSSSSSSSTPHSSLPLPSSSSLSAKPFPSSSYHHHHHSSSPPLPLRVVILFGSTGGTSAAVAFSLFHSLVHRLLASSSSSSSSSSPHASSSSSSCRSVHHPRVSTPRISTSPLSRRDSDKGGETGLFSSSPKANSPSENEENSRKPSAPQASSSSTPNGMLVNGVEEMDAEKKGGEEDTCKKKKKKSRDSSSVPSSSSSSPRNPKQDKDLSLQSRTSRLTPRSSSSSSSSSSLPLHERLSSGRSEGARELSRLSSSRLSRHDPNGGLDHRPEGTPSMKSHLLLRKNSKGEGGDYLHDYDKTRQKGLSTSSHGHFATSSFFSSGEERDTGVKGSSSSNSEGSLQGEEDSEFLHAFLSRKRDAAIRAAETASLGLRVASSYADTALKKAKERMEEKKKKDRSERREKKGMRGRGGDKDDEREMKETEERKRSEEEEERQEDEKDEEASDEEDKIWFLDQVKVGHIEVYIQSMEYISFEDLLSFVEESRSIAHRFTSPSSSGVCTPHLLLFFALSTFSHGTPPPSAEAFYQEVEESSRDFRVDRLALYDCAIAGVGCGSTDYPSSTYCKPAKSLLALLHNSFGMRLFLSSQPLLFLSDTSADATTEMKLRKWRDGLLSQFSLFIHPETSYSSRLSLLAHAEKSLSAPRQQQPVSNMSMFPSTSSRLTGKKKSSSLLSSSSSFSLDERSLIEQQLDAEEATVIPGIRKQRPDDIGPGAGVGGDRRRRKTKEEEEKKRCDENDGDEKEKKIGVGESPNEREHERIFNKKKDEEESERDIRDKETRAEEEQDNEQAGRRRNRDITVDGEKNATEETSSSSSSSSSSLDESSSEEEEDEEVNDGEISMVEKRHPSSQTSLLFSTCHSNVEAEDLEDLIPNDSHPPPLSSSSLPSQPPATSQKKKATKTSSSLLKPMLSAGQAEKLRKEHYKIVGSHSAIKLCRWTKSQLRGRGGCYKNTFYGITSSQCMELTPSLACANKCVFCWRHHKNPVGTSWRWQVDEPDFILQEGLKSHFQTIKELK